jgi:hypothetical protein
MEGDQCLAHGSIVSRFGVARCDLAAVSRASNRRTARRKRGWQQTLVPGPRPGLAHSRPNCGGFGGGEGREYGSAGLRHA